MLESYSQQSVDELLAAVRSRRGWDFSDAGVPQRRPARKIRRPARGSYSRLACAGAGLPSALR
jgi:hypothetical protein